MGHETQIEPWSPFDRRSALLVSELTGFVAKKRWKPLGCEAQQPSNWRGRPEQILLNYVGCES